MPTARDPDLRRDALAVLLPAIDDLDPGEALLGAFDDGCRGLLLAGTGEEFAARAMSAERLASERPDDLRALRCELDRRVGSPCAIALDVEPGGLERLEGLVPRLPAPDVAATMDDAALEAAAAAVGRAMAGLGANVALGPLIDVVTGPNPWLDGRHLGSDPAVVARIGAAIVRGLERSGVTAAVKHFPGHPELPDDPGLGIATMRIGWDALEWTALPPFRAAVVAGARCAMVGPAVIPAIDPDRPSTLSAPTVALLRGGLGFDGIVMGECLNDLAGACGGDIGEAAVQAVAAGCDLSILFGDAALLAGTAEAIVGAVVDGRLDRDALAHAADRARRLAPDAAP